MKYLNEIINVLGMKTIIISVSILVLILVILAYRLLKLKHYRNEIVDLENKMNAIKSLPIQYRLGRVKGIAKNMPELQEKYETYDAKFAELTDLQNDEIIPLVNDIDEALYYRKLRGVQKKMNSLEEKVIHYAKESKQLLKDIEVITEIENIQRLEIIKVKEKYRATNDNYAQIRFKVEDYVPKVQDVFHDIDERFVELENYMNNQQFEEAKTYTEDISKYIDALDQQLSDLPTYISVVRQYLPKRLNELKSIMQDMQEKDFAVERMNATIRISKIDNDLHETEKNIKNLKLENVGQNIEVMTDELNLLYSDFEKEKNAYALYEEKRNECYKFVNKIESGLLEAKESIHELEKNYILDDYTITIEDDYNQLITNNENFPKLYTYEIVVKINLNSAKKNTDNDISEMTVTYEGKEYKFKVGKICVDREAMQNTFAVDLAGKDTAVQTTGNISGITMGETFDMYLDGLVETSSKGVEIQDVYLKNVDNSIKLNDVEITIKNSDGDSNIKFDKSKKIEIPSKSTADFSLNCSNILLKKSVGGRAFPILCIDYKIGDTSGTMNVPIDAVVTPKTSYEIYAYKIDGVNIFD